jgi:hypothetical protein
VLFSLATLTRPRIGEDLSFALAQVDGIARCCAARQFGLGRGDRENGQRLTLHRAAVRAQRTGSGAAQTTWQLPGPATRSGGWRT